MADRGRRSMSSFGWGIVGTERSRGVGVEGMIIYSWIRGGFALETLMTGLIATVTFYRVPIVVDKMIRGQTSEASLSRSRATLRQKEGKASSFL
jgi:hypothetical protein